MCQLKGYENEIEKVCQLQGSLYGLKQALR